jgi:hypothetical protein
MKTRLVTIIIIGCLAAAIGAIPAYGDEVSSEQQKRYYLDCINVEIDNNSCKVALLGSRSRNLQTYGSNAARKAVFLSQNREALVQEMMVLNVSMRPHAVHQYLLQRFSLETSMQAAK